MNRRVLTLFVAGLAVTGCAHSRSSIRDIDRGAERLAPAGASELPPIQTSSDPTRPAVNTWSRGVSQTTRGQSPDQADDETLPPNPPAPARVTAAAKQPAPGAPAPDSARPDDLKSDISPGHLLGITMATVSGEAITSGELQFQFNEFLRERDLNKTPIPPEQANMLVQHILDEMIDRIVIVQEARRTFLKSAKQKEAFDHYCEKQWVERELPPMCRKNKVESAVELRRKLQERGESLDAHRRRFERKFLASEFLNMQLATRVKPTLPEMRSYYQAHRDEFHRDAKVSWREIFVQGQTPEGRRKAEAILDRLRRGEDFAELARTSSDGPTASTGGLWTTGLRASATPAVNSALETLGLKQTSPILEGPRGYHIIRIDDRQEAGPAPFSVVQDKIFGILFTQNFQREAGEYVGKLRSQALITYWVNGNLPAPSNRDPRAGTSDPAAIRTSAEKP